MVCFSPLRGYFGKVLTSKGKRPVVFNLNDAYSDMPVLVPCGQCRGCRLSHSRDWATRCVHEAHMYDNNCCFLTLTFNNDNLPSDGSVRLEDLQKFMHDLRQKLSRKYKKNVELRYFGCGEYGERYKRPHYHLILFGYNFPDKKLWGYSGKMPLYNSEELSGIWRYGYAVIGSVTFESCAYVARYVMKKWKGKGSEFHYKELGVSPEFPCYSLRPGIGFSFFEKYVADIYTKDQVLVRNSVTRGKIYSRPPRYYDKLLERYYPEWYDNVKKSRKNTHCDYIISQERAIVDYERLEAKAVCAFDKMERLFRDYENRKVG